MSQRRAAVLPALVLAAALVTGCGGGDDDTDAGAPSSATTSSAAATTSGSAATRTPSTEGDGTADAPPFPAFTEPDTGAPSASAFLTVIDIRTCLHAASDRVVFELDATGLPGSIVRYDDAATE